MMREGTLTCQDVGLSPAHVGLIKILAAEAVERFLAECDSDSSATETRLATEAVAR